MSFTIKKITLLSLLVALLTLLTYAYQRITSQVINPG